MNLFVRPFKVKLFFFSICILGIPTICTDLFALFTKAKEFKQFIALFVPLLLIILLIRLAYLLYKNSYASINEETIVVSQILLSSQKMKIPGEHFSLKTTRFVVQREDLKNFYFSDTFSTENDTLKSFTLRPLYIIGPDSTFTAETCFYTKKQIDTFLSVVSVIKKSRSM